MSSGRSEVAAASVDSGEETRLGVGTGVLGPDCIRVRSLDEAPGSQWGKGGEQARSSGSSGRRRRRTGEEKEVAGAWGSGQHGLRKPGLQPEAEN